jgi:hypothetical protein
LLSSRSAESKIDSSYDFAISVSVIDYDAGIRLDRLNSGCGAPTERKPPDGTPSLRTSIPSFRGGLEPLLKQFCLFSRDFSLGNRQVTASVGFTFLIALLV